ncbi:MAG: peptidase M16, partial [Chromatiales bacterium]|nr:peptidase M16 [Chromatiales bacterium]
MNTSVIAGLLFASVLCLMSPVGVTQEIARSPSDDREYRYLRLSNGLRIVLISDPDAQVAAASLDVAVGSGADPDDRLGLAHFLEHMVFLGTKEYPEPGEYASYISGNGGSQNAYTSFEHTNYHFDVKVSALQGALDRLARFFVEPLFDERYVERERLAVQAEYASKRRADSQRAFEAFKQVINADHPFARFSVGSTKTLQDLPGKPIRARLIKFFDSHYRAGNMSLVVVGRESLDVLENWVRSGFSGIPSGRTVEAYTDVPLFVDGKLPARLDVAPLKEYRRVTLTFPAPSLHGRYASKPLHYIANIMGDEGPGSLLSSLRAQGLAEGVSAGAGISHRSHATVDISIAATPEGVRRVDDMVGLVFRYLDAIRAEGPQGWRFKESARLAALNFRFMEQGDELGLVQALAHNLHIYPPHDVVRGAYAFDGFNPGHVLDILDRLVPGNLLLRVTGPGAITDRVGPNFESAYSARAITKRELNHWSRVVKPESLALPAENQFIAAQLDMLAEPETALLPSALEESPGFALWHALDGSFERPLASFYVSLRSPAANASARQAVMTSLLVAMVNEQMLEPNYPATVAGLNVRLYRHLRGLSFRVHGYSDKLPILVGEVLRTLSSIEFDPSRFSRMRARLRRGLANASLNKPYTQALSELSNLLLSPYWSSRAMLKSLDTLDLSDLKAFSVELTSSV